MAKVYNELTQKQSEELMYELRGEVNYETEMLDNKLSSRDMKLWTPEYHAGFIDGLKRAVELAQEYCE